MRELDDGKDLVIYFYLFNKINENKRMFNEDVQPMAFD